MKTEQIRHLILAVLLLAPSCERPAAEPSRTEILLDPGIPATRSADPDEHLISDYNILIYNCFGILEEKRFYSSRTLKTQNGKVVHTTQLLRDVPYWIYACANLGYELPRLSLEEVKSYRYHMAYPDEFSKGMPMSGRLENFSTGGQSQVTLPLERAMARIDLSIDRTALNADVSFTVTEVSVGGCPSSVVLFGESKAETAADVFTKGYGKENSQVRALNTDITLGQSGTVSVYLLENRQGDLLDGVTDDRGKIFSDGRYAEVCSYIEIKADYHSDRWHSAPGEHLVYRFYLGGSLNNFDVTRNCRYRVTVRPEGTGLNEDSWRVDKGGLVAETRFQLYPAAYNECAVGEEFHLWCDIFPEGTPVTIEPIAYDEVPVREVYDYEIDPDGHGLTVRSRKGGTALVYFQAGPPVNRDTLALLVIGP